MLATTRIPHSLLATVLLLTACHSPTDRNAPTGPPLLSTLVIVPTTLACRQNFASRPYAFYAASGTQTATGLTSAVVYRPYLGDTLSTVAAGTLIPPASYPGYSSFDVWDVTGGPAAGGTDLYYLLLPKSLPPLGGAFHAQVHVLFDGGNPGWVQSTQDCKVTSGGSPPIVEPSGPISCTDPAATRPYAQYAVKATLLGGLPSGNVVYRPLLGDTLSRRTKGRAVTSSRYPGWPQFKVWNITGGPAAGTNNLFYLLLPTVMPSLPGSAFDAELHVLFDEGRQGWIQSLQQCTLN